MFDKLLKLTVPEIISFPVGVGAVATGTKVLYYLYDEDSRDEMYSGISPPAFYLPRDARVRFLARMTAYIVTVCTLDGILRRSYRAFVKALKEMGYTSQVPGDDGTALLDDRGKEIEPYQFYRNKVFAHTSYADPMRDSKSLQYSSIDYYSMGFTVRPSNYLALGGGSLIIDKEEEGPPELEIRGGHINIREHYSEWERMFTDIIETIPRDELELRLASISLTDY